MNTATTYKPTYTLGSDITINRMGYGAMRITGKGIWGPPADKDEAIRVLQRAVELGVDFIDTADSYGPHVSEELIAEALYPYADNLVIATKGGLLRTGPDQWPVNAHPDHLREALEGSLERLKVDSIQLYQLHRIDPNVPFEDSLAFLQKAQEDGLIQHIGLSEVKVAEIQKAQEYVDIVSVQNMYSFDNRKWEAELQFCNDEGIGFIPWYPLGGGNSEALTKLEQFAQKKGVSLHQLALSWLLHYSPNILLIPGTSRVKHLEENIAAAAISLNEEEMELLEKIAGR
ncbi:aryl-alcohol dehydrogenase-like predicted oxidoreductase [Filimonas zeae]|uniref:Oxidoreductase n=1 Tax=Filimonas zeae TaxID=1737353 RepID=A0A917J3V2_9BACT|nr:aldo/keto reductase [Filimonas zeae]MDR6342374.1 aryl-alcohol dehydrogenase-like predicted oxidoreductase [Filimonas zeae]GGH81076.1 oxidoreductase [Filimonas zeae]